MLVKFSRLNPKGLHLSLEKEKEKDNFCVVFTFIRGARKIGLTFTSQSCNADLETYKKA